MQIKRTLPNNRNRASVDDKGTVRGTWRPISLDWRMQSGVAFYDSTWWRYAKGLPPRDKCCRPFRPQLRIPIESLSRKTDKSEVIWADKSEWIGAWIIFDFEILVAAGYDYCANRIASAALSFARWSMRSVLSILLLFQSPPRISLSLRVVSIRWTRSKKELWNGNRRWNYRRIDRS